MSKRKNTSARRPVKARGTLAAPRVAPRRTRVPVHKRRWVRLVAALLLLALVALGVQLFLKARAESRRLADERRTVSRFERSVGSLEVTLQAAVGEMFEIPGRFAAGDMEADEFRGKADEWIVSLRSVAEDLLEREVPSFMEESRALFYNGVILYLDAAKTFGLAADAEQPEVRSGLIAQARTLTSHAGSVLGLARRALEKEKLRVGLGEEFDRRIFLEQPIPLPPEEAEPLPAELGEEPVPEGEVPDEVPEAGP